MPIKGLSEQRRLPRIGKIRLGVQVQEPGRKAYPKATDWFVCPPAVQAVYGEQPTKLSILFPSDDPGTLFVQDYKAYKTAGLWCKGDGEQALRWNAEGALAKVPCPCPLLDSGECRPEATLSFCLPDVPGLGVWQITTSAKRSIVGINSALERFASAFGGLRGVPFDLFLELETTQRFDEKQGKQVKTTIHTLRLDSPHTLREVLAWRRQIGAAAEPLMLPGPEPEEAPGDESPTEEPPVAPVSPILPTSTIDMPAMTAAASDDREPPWTIERCFAEAEALGVSPITYRQYLEGLTGGSLDNLAPEVITGQGEQLRAAADGGEKAGRAWKLTVLQTLKAAAEGRARARR